MWRRGPPSLPLLDDLGGWMSEGRKPRSCGVGSEREQPGWSSTHLFRHCHRCASATHSHDTVSMVPLLAQVVNGPHRGKRGKLVSIDTERFQAQVLLSGDSREVWLEYEDCCKLDA